jgi:hypothetical protein
MELATNSQDVNDKKTKPKKIINSAEIYYNGVGSNFRNYFSENEFRKIINKNIKYYSFNDMESEYYNYFKEAIEDPLHCNLDILINLTGSKKL